MVSVSVQGSGAYEDILVPITELCGTFYLHYSGGEWVKVAERMVAYYKVENEPKTYKFRVTVYDKDDNNRQDDDTVDVVIGGGRYKLTIFFVL